MARIPRAVRRPASRAVRARQLPLSVVFGITNDPYDDDSAPGANLFALTFNRDVLTFNGHSLTFRSV